MDYIPKTGVDSIPKFNNLYKVLKEFELLKPNFARYVNRIVRPIIHNANIAAPYVQVSTIQMTGIQYVRNKKMSLE